MAGYTNALRAANRSPDTIRLYRHYLTLLRDVRRTPWAVGAADLQAFVGRESWGASARRSARTAVCGFYRWAHGMGYMPDDPSLALPTVTVPKGRPRPAPERLVLLVTGDEAPEKERFMCLLGAELGMRAGEISRVHARDWAPLPDHPMIHGLLTVHGKGGKIRDLPVVGDELAKRLDRLDGWAFPTRVGRGPWLDKPVTPGYVSRIMSASLDRYTAHQLRHRCGTEQYRKTRDLLAVSRFLGHAQLETTRTYVEMPDDALTTVAYASAV